MKTLTAELCLDARARLGEGPSWRAPTGELIWVDIEGHAVHLYRPSDGTDRVIEVGQHVGAAVPRTKGGIVVALRDGFGVLDEGTGTVEMIADTEADVPGNRMNDGKCDPRGRFWAGTMALDFTKGAGSLYRLDPDASVRQMVTGVTVSNGLGWSPDERTMYYIDTPTRRIDRFDYDAESGRITNRRGAVEVPEAAGLPDGMCVDADGALWVALWSGGAVQRYTPAGELDLVVEVPVRYTTSCAFGGPELDELYITTASDPVSDKERAAQPHAGGLFVCSTGSVGLPSQAYAG